MKTATKVIIGGIALALGGVGIYKLATSGQAAAATHRFKVNDIVEMTATGVDLLITAYAAGPAPGYGIYTAAVLSGAQAGKSMTYQVATLDSSAALVPPGPW